jgi:hypothetical protein
MGHYDVGKWVVISKDAQDNWGVGPGPYRILRSEPGHHGGNALDIGMRSDDGHIRWIRDDHCLPSDPPAKTLSEKEREALESEGWRRRRDENLREMFRPQERPNTKRLLPRRPR